MIYRIFFLPAHQLPNRIIRDWNKEKNKQICCFVCFQYASSASVRIILYLPGRAQCIQKHNIQLLCTRTYRLHWNVTIHLRKKEKITTTTTTKNKKRTPNQTVHFPKYLNYFLRKFYSPLQIGLYVNVI